MGKRVMPKAGFYVRPPTVGTDIHGNPWSSGGSIYYTTGIRGGGGHKYIRFDLDHNDRFVPSDVTSWLTLLWSCVPGKKEMPYLVYARILSKAIDIYNSGLILNYNNGNYKLEKHGLNKDPIKMTK